MKEKEILLPYLVFETCRECNLDCLHCYNYWKSDISTSLPGSTYDQAKRTLRELLRQVKVGSISLSGGEPFMLKGFSELVLFLRMKGVCVNIITNGTVATDDDYRNLSQLKINVFEIPLHSSEPQIHDQITNVKGSWFKTVHSIEFLLNTGCVVCGVFVPTKINISTAEVTINFLESLGIRHLMMNRFNIGGNGIKHIKELIPDKKAFENAFAVADRIAQKGTLKISSNVCIPKCQLNTEQFKNIHFTNCGKNIYQMPITLDFQGNVRICNHSPFISGNIFNEKLTDILHKKSITEWFEYLPEECFSCKYKHRCAGGCKAAGEQYFGQKKKSDPIIIPGFS